MARRTGSEADRNVSRMLRTVVIINGLILGFPYLNEEIWPMLRLTVQPFLETKLWDTAQLCADKTLKDRCTPYLIIDVLLNHFVLGSKVHQFNDCFQSR